MDEWDNKNNGTGPDAEQTDSANDTHIENNADQMPPYTQQAPYQSSFGAGGYYQQGGPSQNQQGQQPYQSPYQYNQAPASGGGPDGSGPQKKKKKTGLIVLIVILCIALVAAGIGIAIGLTRDDGDDSGNKAVNPDGPTLAIEETPDSQSTTNEKGELTAEEVAKKVKPSIVGVIVSETAQNNMMGQNQSKSGEGTGIIMGEDKTGKYTYIITCAHVISGNNVKATVQLEDGTSYDADVVGYDERSDVGVLRIKASGLQAATFGDSSKLAVGQQIFAIGNPLGTEFFGTLTGGFVSAIDRPISSEIGYPMKCIQHDAAINPGNSGGALVDADGKLIGINTLITSYSGNYSGVGFAIPVNYAVNLAQQIIDGKTPTHAQLGVSLSTVNAQNAQRYGLSADAGAYVAAVSEGSGAAEAGLQEGDIITKFDGENVESASDLMLDVRSKNPGDKVTLDVNRNGETKQIEVTLGSDESTQNASTQQNNAQESMLERLFGGNSSSQQDAA